MGKVHQTDEKYYLEARAHIAEFLVRNPVWAHSKPMAVLEIGPSGTLIPRRTCSWDTLDIVHGSTFQADITKPTPILDDSYDVALCMEVLEHTVDPFAAVREIRRILKPGGLLLASAPFNFRIHGPLPDCWRFSEHGWRVLLKDFDEVQIDALESERFLAPIHYNVSARCNKEKNVDPRTFEWRFIE